MRRHLTKSGRFEVAKDRGFIYLEHAPLNKAAGRFSHISVRTIKEALAGVERAEAMLSPADLALIDMPPDRENLEQRAALLRLRDALVCAFPNGGWGT